MASMTNYLENQIIDWLFREGTYTPPATWYAALFIGGPLSDDAGNGITEVTGGDYARVGIDGTAAKWDRTNRDNSGSASSGTTGSTANRVTITYATPTADWGLITHMGLFDASTGGNLLLVEPLISPREVLNGDVAPKFVAGSLVVTIDSEPVI